MCMWSKIDGFPCRYIFAVIKFLNIRHILDSLIIKRLCKDAKSESPLLLPEPSDNQTELFEMSRYDSLNSDAQMMNYYASKLECSHKIANDEITLLTAMFKAAFQENSSIINTNQINPVRFMLTLTLSGTLFL